MSLPPDPVPVLMEEQFRPGGTYERLAGPPDPSSHRCRPPGWWRRRQDGVKSGAIWRCDCGKRYEFLPERRVLVNVGQPGARFAPWWPAIPREREG